RADRTVRLDHEVRHGVVEAVVGDVVLEVALVEAVDVEHVAGAARDVDDEDVASGVSDDRAEPGEALRDPLPERAAARRRTGEGDESVDCAASDGEVHVMLLSGVAACPQSCGSPPDRVAPIISLGGSRGRGVDADEVDEDYALIAEAMESAFVDACRRRPALTAEERFVALLLLKDRILEQHLPPDALAPELAAIARALYDI